MQHYYLVATQRRVLKVDSKAESHITLVKVKRMSHRSTSKYGYSYITSYINPEFSTRYNNISRLLDHQSIHEHIWLSVVSQLTWIVAVLILKLLVLLLKYPMHILLFLMSMTQFFYQFPSLTTLGGILAWLL